MISAVSNVAATPFSQRYKIALGRGRELQYNHIPPQRKSLLAVRSHDERLPPLRIEGPSTNQIRGIATPDFHGTELQFTTGKQATRAFCKLPTGAVVARPLVMVDRMNPAALGAKPGETHVCPCCTQSSIRPCGNPTRGPAFLTQDCLDGDGHRLQRQSFNHSLSAVFGYIHVHKNTILTHKGVS